MRALSLLSRPIRSPRHRVGKLAALFYLVVSIGVTLLVASPETVQEPPDPKPSAAVQTLLDEADQFTKQKQLQDALKAAERALAVAQESKDAIGEARAHRSRALTLQELRRTEEAVAAWRQAAAAWERIGDSPGRVAALATAALLLWGSQPTDAEALLAQALQLGRAESKRPLATATMLHKLGDLYYERRRLGPARQLLETSLRIRERLAPSSLDVARSLNGLGRVAWQERDLAVAADYYRRALVIQEQQAPNSLEVASSLNNLAVVARFQGDLAAATDYHRRALVIREQQAPNSRDMAGSLTNLGVVALDQGDLAAATDYHRRALLIFEQQVPSSLDVAASLNNLGYVAWREGNLAAASSYHRRALVIREQQAPSSLDVATSLVNLGSVATEQGDWTAANNYYRQALVIQRQHAPNSLDVAASLNNLGTVARRQGDLAAATDYFQRALAIKEQLGNSIVLAVTLNNLGSLAERQGNLTMAADYHRRALTVLEQGARNSLEVARSLSGLGNVARRHGDLTAAADYYQRALVLREQRALNSLEMASSLIDLGSVGEKQGDWVKAERLLQQAWEIVRQQAAQVAGDEARQAFGAANASCAADLLRSQLVLGRTSRAFQTLEEGRAQALQQLLMERQLMGKVTSNPLWSSYQKAIAERDGAERAVSKASVAETVAQRELAAKRTSAPAPDQMARLQASVDNAAKQFAEAQAAYTRARVKADGLWTDIKKSAPRVFAPPLDWEHLQNVLPAETLFVAFSVGDEQAYVFLLRSGMRTELGERSSDVQSPRSKVQGLEIKPNQQHDMLPLGSRTSDLGLWTAGDRSDSAQLSAYPLAGSVKEIEALVDAFREQITNIKDLDQTLITSRSLFVKLFPPETRAALTSAQRLLISPDGPLWEVPFAALVTNAQGAPKYLGDEKAITYTPSLTLLAQSRADAPQLAKGHSPSALVLGYPIFDRRLQVANRKVKFQTLPTKLPTNSKPETRNSKLTTGERSYLFAEGNPPPPLRRTRAEALEIARLYGTAALLEGEATEAELRKRIGSADVVHLATHAYLNPVRAMSSGLLLTEPEKEPEIGETDNDGVLQAWEIYSQLKLRAELVVLSACETGRGERVRGEGIVGMTRALQYAGARSIVASQWKVDDRSTAMLMVGFHRNLRKGMAKDAALQQAMVEVRRRSKRTAHPYYWAAFMLTGDPENPNLKQ